MQLACDGQDPCLKRIEDAIRARAVGTSLRLAQVGTVILVVSSSRGGSSVFAELLRRSEGFLHCRGEVTPFLRIVGLSFPDSGTQSDTLAAPHAPAGAARLVTRRRSRSARDWLPYSRGPGTIRIGLVAKT